MNQGWIYHRKLYIKHNKNLIFKSNFDFVFLTVKLRTINPSLPNDNNMCVCSVALAISDSLWPHGL